MIIFLAQTSQVLGKAFQIAEKALNAAHFSLYHDGWISNSSTKQMCSAQKQRTDVLQTLGCLTFTDCSKPWPNKVYFVFNTPRHKFSPQIHAHGFHYDHKQPSTYPRTKRGSRRLFITQIYTDTIPILRTGIMLVSALKKALCIQFSSSSKKKGREKLLAM